MRLATASTKTRPPAVAGMFYPQDARELQDTVSAYLRQAPRHLTAPAKAFIVPHAGYIYSGGVAAAAYVQIEERRQKIRRVVLIGPSHRVYLRGMAVPVADAFSTPLGDIPVDAELRARLLSHASVIGSDAPHAQEHCLEVQLPFLQMLLDEFTLLPLVLGATTPQQVGAALDEVWGGEETLVLVSSDLSHYLPYDVAQQADAATIAAIAARDTGLAGEQACGAAGINGLCFVAQQRDLQMTELARCNSGDTAGDRARVVGYGAFAFHEPATRTA